MPLLRRFLSTSVCSCPSCSAFSAVCPLPQVQDDAEAAAASRVAAPAAGGDGGNDAAALQHARATMGVAADEAEFQGVVPLEAKEYWWREKHKPRRPKFFNKVHTGAPLWSQTYSCLFLIKSLRCRNAHRCAPVASNMRRGGPSAAATLLPPD